MQKPERLVLADVSNQNIERATDNLNSARSSEYTSLKLIQRGASEMNSIGTTSKKRSESKEFLKLKSEVDISKLNEESLRNDISV
jgi:hypothetical protein